MNSAEYIEQTLTEYLPRRYPRATAHEREKYARDWRTKDRASAGIVADYTKRIGEVAGKKILDAGSGIGGISIALAQAGAHPVGVEVEEDLYTIGIENTRLHNTEAEYVLYDGFVLPFENEQFDGAISVSVLEHTDDPVAYLSEILRVLKRGGKLYLAFPNRIWPKETHTGLYFLGLLPRPLARIYISLLKRNPLEDNSLHFYSYWSLQRMLKKAGGTNGFRIVPEEGASQLRVYKLIKKVLPYIGIPTHRALLPHVSVIVEKL